MGKNVNWQDEFWLILLQLYQKKPVGMKPLYSKSLINLSLELHIPPQEIYDRMFQLRNMSTPFLKRLWDTYGNNPRKLNRDVKQIKQNWGFGSGGSFYEGIETNETFEKDFKPLPQDERLTPMMLIMILDLYFRLVPQTMVTETPEVGELSKLIGIPDTLTVEVMEVFQLFDPFLQREDFSITPLLIPCQQIWQRYANGSPQELAAIAAQMKEYFK